MVSNDGGKTVNTSAKTQERIYSPAVPCSNCGEDYFTRKGTLTRVACPKKYARTEFQGNLMRDLHKSDVGMMFRESNMSPGGLCEIKAMPNFTPVVIFDEMSMVAKLAITDKLSVPTVTVAMLDAALGCWKRPFSDFPVINPARSSTTTGEWVLETSMDMLELLGFEMDDGYIRHQSGWSITIGHGDEHHITKVTTGWTKFNYFPNVLRIASSGGPTRDAKVGKIYLHPSMRDAIRSNVPEMGGVSTHPLQLLLTTHLGDASNGVFYRSTVPHEYDSALDEVHLARVDERMVGENIRTSQNDGYPIEMGDRVRMLTKEVSGMHADTSVFGGALVTLGNDAKVYRVSKGQGMNTVPLAMWAAEFADLGDLRMPSREKKNLIQLVKETRAADDTTIVTKWRNLLNMAGRGSTYLRFFVKAWLDFMQTQLIEELGDCDIAPVDNVAIEWLVARVLPVQAPGPHECANNDTIEVENRASSIIMGETFLCSGDYDELDDKFYGLVRRYAGSWPPEIATHQGKTMSTSAIEIPGARRIMYLVGNSTRNIDPTLARGLTSQEILAFIDHYATRVGAFEDAMVGFELASAFGLRTRIGRLEGIGSVKSHGIDAMWSSGGLRLPSDNSLAAFFQPFNEVENPSAEIHTMTTDTPHRVLALAARYHMWQSISTQTSWIASNITKEMLEAAIDPRIDNGKSSVQVNELTRLLGGAVRLPKLMMMQLACSVWMFGFRMRTNSIRCITFTDPQLCGKQFLNACRGTKCVPAVWLGFEGLDVSFNMPDVYVPPLPGHVIKQTPIGGYPYEPQPSERDNAARLARAIAPLIDGAWIGDGGPAYSANFYAQVTVLKRLNWEKPTNRNLPKAAT